MVFTRFAYDPLRITLGQVQLLSNYLRKLPVLAFLAEHDKLCFLLMALAFIFVPLLRKPREKFSKFKVVASTALVFLSIIFSLSFFGTPAGKVASDRGRKLDDLALTIHAVHDSIFLKLTQVAVLENYGQTISVSQDSVEKIIAADSSVLQKEVSSAKVPGIRAFMNDTLLTLVSKFRSEHTLSDLAVVRNIPVENQLSQGESSYFSYARRDGTAASYATYMGRPQEWNQSDGEILLKQVRTEVEQMAFQGRLKDAVEVFSEYLLSTGIDGLAGALKAEGLKFASKLAELISKNSFVPKMNEAVYNYLSRLTRGGRVVFAGGGLKIRTSGGIDYARTSIAAENELKTVFDQKATGKYAKGIRQNLFPSLSDPAYTNERSHIVDLVSGRLEKPSLQELDAVLTGLSGTVETSAQLNLLHEKGILSETERAQFDALSHRISLYGYIGGKLPETDKLLLKLRLNTLSVSRVKQLEKFPADDFPGFLDQLRISGLLSHDEATNQEKAYFKQEIDIAVNRLVRSDNTDGALRNRLLSRLTENRDVSELRSIYESSSDALNMFGWLSSMAANGTIDFAEVDTFHPLCTCFR